MSAGSAWRDRLLPYLQVFSCLHALIRNVWPMSPPSQPEKGQSCDDLGVHDHLNEHIEERDDLELLELVVADLAQLGLALRRVGHLQQVFPHLVDLIGLKHVRRRPCRR